MARILVIEDEPPLLELLCDLLESGGHQVLGVDHPDRVPAHGVAPDPDLVFIDLMLPGRDGITLAGELRASGYATTPMVAMSASRQLLGQAAASGFFQATLPKPFEMETMLRIVLAPTSLSQGPAPR
jgi:CheY-like chemotaxis protein